MKNADNNNNSNKQVSRQRRWQIQKKEEGNCLTCGQPIWEGSSNLCKIHTIQQRERQRKRSGCIRRNWNAKTYLMESSEDGKKEVQKTYGNPN